MHQDPFSGLEPGVVEQHVLDGRVRYSHAGGVAVVHAVGDLHGKPRGMVGEFLRETIDVEAAHAGDILAQVFASPHARRAGAADQCGIRHHPIPRRNFRNAITDGDYLAGGLGADAQREPPLGEGHATEAPHVDVVQPDAPHAQLHLTRRRRSRRVALPQHQFSVGQKLQRADRGHGAVPVVHPGIWRERGRPATIGPPQRERNTWPTTDR